MKHLLPILISAIILSSCDMFRKIAEPRPLSMGGVEAKLNGEMLSRLFPPEQQEARASYAGYFKEPTDPISINFGFYDADNLLKAGLSWAILSPDTGTFAIQEDEKAAVSDLAVKAEFYTLIGGDVLGNSYKVLPSIDNYFTLESYEASSRVMKGNFNVTFVLASNKNDRDFPDTLRFTDGRFETKIFTKEEFAPYQ